MENASKALIIAGAILLSILIIGLGMYIYGQAADAMDTGKLDSAKVQAYNEEFLKYKGIITGTQARQLCNAITNHNRITAEDSSQFVGVEVSTNPNYDVNSNHDGTNGAGADDDAATFNATLSSSISSIRAGYTYKVTYTYEKGSGLIVYVGLAKQNN